MLPFLSRSDQDPDSYLTRMFARQREAMFQALMESLPDSDHDAARWVYKRIGHDFSPTAAPILLPVFQRLMEQLPFRDDPEGFYDHAMAFLYGVRLLSRFMALPPPSPDETTDLEADLLVEVADAYIAQARERADF